MRAAATITIAVLLIACAATGAVLALFTMPVFDLLGFNPIALDYFDGRITRGDLEDMVIIGTMFSSAEISHLDDVAALLVFLSRVFIAVAAILLIAVFAAPEWVRGAATLALGVVVATGLAIVAAYFLFGFYAVGVFLHEIVFPSGNWQFSFDSLIIRLYGTEVMVAGTLFAIAIAIGTLVITFLATRSLRSRIRE